MEGEEKWRGQHESVERVGEGEREKGRAEDREMA
jgi:hypothetical protein